MSYQVLARKWRPRTFHELVGQEHVSRALVNALDQGRLHHAYLFTGTRGVGKTTLARILAKCLNCEQGVTSKPCGECQTCQAIDNGRFVDLIEVDAASRTKVEDTRELLDNVQYAPTQGRFKVYLIDEVHMLSTHSFNALLKTLEEPPPHVKFLLATTDPQKLPVTVLSRCLQFTLKNMPPERVVEHLTRVLEAERVPFEPQALWLLGKAADGSMRDAMSLTDQAIAFGQGEIRRDDVAAMLGTLDHAHLIALAEALAEVDAERLLAEVAALAEQGPDFAGILDELAGLMHRLAIAQMVPNALDNGHGDREQLLAMAGRFTAEDVQLYYQIALQGRGDIDNAPDTRTALEMTLLRMLAFRPQGVPTPPQTDLPLRGHKESASPAASADAASAATAPGATTGSTAATSAERDPSAAAAGEAPAPSTTSLDESTASLTEQVIDDRPPWPTVSEQAAEAAAQEAPASERAQTSQAHPETASSRHSEAGATSASPATSHNDSAGASASWPADSAPAWDDTELADPADSADVRATEAQAVSAPKPEPSAAIEPVSTPESEPGADGADKESASTMPLETPRSQTSVSSQPTGQAASAPIEDVPSPQPSTAAGLLSHALWLEHFDRLEVGGLTRNLAAHCVVAGDDGRVLQLTLDPGQAAMLSELHVERITKALEAQGYARRVEVEVADIDGRFETAKAKRDREARERHVRAVEALRGDPHVQELETRFGARLMEDSVTASRI